MAKRRKIKRKGLLFQNLPPRGTGLKRGTARPRGMGRPLSDAERARRHKSIYGQSDGSIIISVMNRFRSFRNSRIW